MASPQTVLELIERFDRNRTAYKSEQYNEARLRIEFLNPLFEALGWDINNKQGYAEAYKDVIYEDAIKIGGATKAPDYCFRVGGTRKFFVEAKKPTINLREASDPAFQLRRYAWSAKLPMSILTDFEEFIVYDCRVKPDREDKASTARILYLPFTDYDKRWEELSSIFSREAILKGSFDTYAEATRGKRGTAEVDEAFLQEIESWREMLARHLAQRNKNLTQRELNYAVQMTIDRIIFLRICEDRGIEEYERLKALLKGSNIYKRLCDIFVEADEKYNSGLFHFQKEKDVPEPPDTLTPHLVIDDKPIKDIMKRLYYPDSPYEFSALPADVLGHVYEQFLGKVIHLTPAHQITVEEKPEVRKAGGVYYTPTFIVDYIVQHTLSKLLEGKKPGVRGSASKVKIVDPACGSGSFLIVVYQYLLDWHRDRYVEDGTEKHRKELYQGAGGQWLLTTQEKKRILLNSIYGVDIDTQAVEVTKLSLLLKVLEGESSQSLNSQLRLFHERALPDLDRNIKCGNSLIGSDFYDIAQISFFDEEERYRINVFDWMSAFPEVFTGDNPGFNAVIGNPPYGASLSKEETNYLLAKYQFQQYQLDTYLLFFEKAFKLLKQDGMFGMIIPNTWLLNLQSDRIRQSVFQHTQIENIVHYRRPVFPKVSVDTEIVIISNEEPGKNHEITVSITEKNGTTTDYAVSQARWQAGNGKPVNLFEKPEFVALADKLRGLPNLANVCFITQGSKPFQVGKGKPPQTQTIVNEKPFVSEIARDSSFRPLLRGSLIQKFRILWNNDYWISFGDWLAEPRYSANYDAPVKIVIRQTGDSLIAALDKDQFIVRDNLYTIIPRQGNLDLRYVLGILNSRLLNWFYQRIINPEQGEALAQVKRGHLALIPVFLPDLSSQVDKSRYDRLVELVEQMLSLNKRFIDARTPHEKTILQQQIDITDQQIDRLVYELYGLTDEEIKMVAEQTNVKGVSEPILANKPTTTYN